MTFLLKIKEKIQYPKLILLVGSVALSYFLFQHNFFTDAAAMLNSHGYVSMFIAGFLFSYGFTTPIAIGFFVTLAPQVSLLPAAFLAAIGAVSADLLIFRFIRSSFLDELEKLQMTLLFQKIKDLFHAHVSDKLKKYVLWTLAGFLIASPLPDEFGVSLISGFTNINRATFAAIAFVCDFVGILVVLAISI